MLRRLEGPGTFPRGFEDTRGRRKLRPREDSYDADTAALEETVFGRQPFVGVGETADHDSSSDENQTSDDEEEERRRDEVVEKVSRKSVWHDCDDDILTVNISQDPRMRRLRTSEEETLISGTDYTKRLRAEFQVISKQPQWAVNRTKRRKEGSSSEEEEEEEEEEDNLLQRTGKLLATSVDRLHGGYIDVKRMKDVNASKKPPSVLQSVEFHPSSDVVLTAGMHKTLDLFKVDGDSNPLLQSVHLERFPITRAHFTASGEEIIMVGQRKWFYVYNMVAGKVTRIHEIRGHSDVMFTDFEVSPDNQTIAFIGKDGYIPLVSNKTKQWITDLKMNGDVRALSFTPDSRYLLSAGSDGHVYVWDMSTCDCVHRFTDDGCIVGNTLAVSPNGQFFACGSDSGVVNIYDDTCLHNDRPRPVKSVMNLTTSISSLAFNHNSEILAVASRRKKEAVRLVHLSSMSVFSNWPSSHTVMGYVYSLGFSSNNKFITTGNDRGRAQLYRLNHYFKGGTHQ